MDHWTVHEGTDLAPLEPRWRAAEAAGNGTVFQSFAFARHWADIFASTHRIEVWAHRNWPVLLPLARHHSGLTLLGSGLFDYLDLVGAPGAPGQLPALGAVAFVGLPASSPFLPLWRQWCGAPAPFCEAPLLPPCALAAFEAAHPRPLRRWNAAQAAGIVLEAVTDTAARRQLAAWLLHTKNQNLAAQGQSSVLAQSEQAWIHRMVAAEPQLAELWRLHRAGETLSALLCWRWQAVRYAYTICYERSAAALSPGILLLFALISRTLAEGASFDFLTGGQAFKQRFAAATMHLLQYPPHQNG